MLYVGIDVAKHKHDCFITNDDGECLAGSFEIQNSKAGFSELLHKIKEFQPKPSLENVKVGLEATGHYSDNIVNFLDQKRLDPVVFNPLQTNLYRKSQTLRKTKTDKVDAQFIAKMLMEVDYAPHTSPSYHVSELKCLTRHRHRLVKQQSAFKISYARLLDIVFPELAASGIVSSSELKSVYALFLDLPNARAIAGCHLTHLSNLLSKNSRGRMGKDAAIRIRDLARDSIGSSSPALETEMRQTIEMVQSLQAKIDDTDKEIKRIMSEIAPPILGIPGIGYTLAAIIIAEIGDVKRFDSPAKLQAYAGLDPSTYQSGKFNSTMDTMVKRGSTYLRWALLFAGRLTAKYDRTFGEVLERKLAEGKHYNVAVSHVAKKLIRVIYHLMLTGQSYEALA
jgi:transposase